MLLLVVGLVAIAPSVVTGSIVVLATILIAVQARLEERHLLSVHGAAYRVYASRVGRFVPGLGTLAAR
jgi:protein-S-isoprenylcysteine O-methyltransferase Ste14